MERDAAGLLVPGDAPRHGAEDQLRGRQAGLRRVRREVGGDRHAREVADQREPGRVRLGLGVARERVERLLDHPGRRRAGIGRTRAVHLLEAGEQDEVALAGEVLDPGAVGLRVDRAPGVQHHRDRPALGRGRAAAVEREGDRPRPAERPLHHRGRGVGLAARSLLGLGGRRGSPRLTDPRAEAECQDEGVAGTDREAHATGTSGDPPAVAGPSIRPTRHHFARNLKASSVARGPARAGVSLPRYSPAARSADGRAPVSAPRAAPGRARRAARSAG